MKDRNQGQNQGQQHQKNAQNQPGQDQKNAPQQQGQDRDRKLGQGQEAEGRNARSQDEMDSE